MGIKETFRSFRSILEDDEIRQWVESVAPRNVECSNIRGKTEIMMYKSDNCASGVQEKFW